MGIPAPFKAGIGYGMWHVTEDATDFNIEVYDEIKIKGALCRVGYVIYPKQSLEKITISKLEDEFSSNLIVALTKEDGKVYKISSGNEIRVWEKANRIEEQEGMTLYERVFDLFYMELKKRYPIEDYIIRSDQEIKEALERHKIFKKLNKQELEEKEKKHKKEIKHMKNTPHPLKRFLC